MAKASDPPRYLGVSITAHCVVIALLFLIRFSGVSRLPAVPEHFTLLAPAAPMLPVPRRIPVAPIREFHPLPQARAQPAIAPALLAPVIESPKVALPEMIHPALAIIDNIPAKPIIQKVAFVEANPAAPVAAPKLVVKSSGFESSAETTAASAHALKPSLGSFDSAPAAERGPMRNGSLKTTGFSETSTTSPAAIRKSAVATAAFGDSTVEKGTAVLRASPVAARATPVEILSKTRPAYTTEARAKNVEGEVLLEVLFNVAGEARVLRMVRGLGHGLDETAALAAQGIRFRPATREGVPVDSTALVHIVFQLAN